MSLINKMLQDLDARGSTPTDGAQAAVKAVPDNAGTLPPRLIAAGGALLVLLVVAGFFGWRAWQRSKVVAPVPMVGLPGATAPSAGVLVMPTKPAVAPLASAPQQAAVAPPAAPQPVVAAPVATVPAPQGPEAKPAVAVTSTPVASARLAPKKASPTEPKPAKVAAVNVPEVAPQPGREMSDQQRAESEYRRGLATMQEGRVAEAMLALEKALAISPQHEAARQTLIGLLLEGHRYDDAMRHLQLGLTLDPRQPAMAMLLARLQIERGGPGIDTLMRTLPYAEASAEYQAFLAGALQREQRHREAAEHYLAAVRRAPDNGVWWMGMGISLQAEKRSAEALDAFQRARAATGLTPELQAFVDRKLVQLAR